MKNNFAYNSYINKNNLHDYKDILNLSWSYDEIEILETTFNHVLYSLKENMLENIRNYWVKDPYSIAFLREGYLKYFSLDKDSPIKAISGAGVISILCLFAKSSRINKYHIPFDVYPDFPTFINIENKVIKHSLDNKTTKSKTCLFIENPMFFNEAEQEDILEKSKNYQYVLIDESNLNYDYASKSFVRFITNYKNIIVIRGFSKGLSLGGIRGSICLFHASILDEIQEIIPPFLCSSLSLHIMNHILKHNELSNTLIQRVQTARRIFSDLLKEKDILTNIECHTSIVVLPICKVKKSIIFFVKNIVYGYLIFL